MTSRRSKENELMSKVLMIAAHTIETRSTVRSSAEKFNLSKSTVHRYLTVNLKELDENMYNEVKSILNENNKTKHIEGGRITKKKFMNLKE